MTRHQAQVIFGIKLKCPDAVYLVSTFEVSLEAPTLDPPEMSACVESDKTCMCLCEWSHQFPLHRRFSRIFPLIEFELHFAVVFEPSIGKIRCITEMRSIGTADLRHRIST